MDPSYAAHSTPTAPRIGLFSIGLDAYWPQFPGLEDRLNEYSNRIARKLKTLGADVVHLGLIDNPTKASEAGHHFRQADVDLIFLHVATYALSSTVLPVVRRARVPVVLLNLAPAAAIDYDAFNRSGDRARMTGEWLAFCQACPVPEIANVFSRCRIPFFQVTGLLENDAVAWREVEEWVAAARVATVMEHNRLGLMGHYYGGMLDIYSDLTLQCACFGGHVEMIEVDELAALREGVTEADVASRIERFFEVFDIQPDCSREELARAARTSVALDRLVETHALGSLAYFYSGSGNAANEDTISSIILGSSLLTARGIPVAGEMEIKNVQAMKILDSFGAGGSFTEFYGVDYNDDIILMGHDGPGHIGIAEGRTKGAPARCLSRQGGPRPFRRDEREMRARHHALRGGGARRRVEAAFRRGPGGVRTDSGDRQHQQPLPLPLGRPWLHECLERSRARTPLRRRSRTHRGETAEARRLVGAGVHSRLLTLLRPLQRRRVLVCCRARSGLNAARQWTMLGDSRGGGCTDLRPFWRF